MIHVDPGFLSGNLHHRGGVVFFLVAPDERKRFIVAVYAFDPLRDPRWPELLDRHPAASVFHSRGWLDPLRRTYGYEPIGYTTSPPGAELANGVVFCRIHSWLTGRRLVSLPFSDHSQPLADREGDLHDVLGLLSARQKRDDWKYIELRPRDESTSPPGGFEHNRRFYFHRLDLRPPLDALFRSFHKSCTQRKIRRAEREGVTCEAGRSEALLAKFYQLLLMTCRRKRLPPQPMAWFRHLSQSLGEALTISVASKNDRPIAAIVTLTFKGIVVYKYGCSDARFNNLGGTHLLLWNVIRDAKRRCLQEFDFGRSDLHMPGLVAFKDRWATTRSVMTYWRSAPRPVPHERVAWIMRLAQQVFAHMPDPVLIAAGKTLYRHIG